MRGSSTQRCGRMELRVLGWSYFDFFVDFLERDETEFLRLALMFQTFVHQTNLNSNSIFVSFFEKLTKLLKSQSISIKKFQLKLVNQIIFVSLNT